MSPSITTTKDNSTLFLLVKFDRKDPANAICFNSFFTIQHVQSQYWIRSVALLDRSQHFIVESSLKQNQSEFFRLLPVSMSQLSLIEYVQQRLPYLEAYASALQARTPLSQIKPIQTILIELIQWVQSPSPPADDPLRPLGKPIKSHQSLLGNASILDLLLKFLSLPFVPGYNTLSALESNPAFRFHCELVYCLLTKIAHRRPKIASHLHKHMPLFSSQNGTCLPVFALLEEIVNDNHNVSSKISSNDLNSFILTTTQTAIRSSDFLDFLTKLCVSNDQPITHNQEAICRSLLVRNPFYFFQTRVEETSPYPFKIFSISMDGEVFTRMDSFLWQADRAMVKFYISSLKLFSSLCFGRNTTSITEVRKFLSWEEAFSGLMWSDLPFHMRSAYCDVLHHVYLNCPPNDIHQIDTVYPVRSGGNKKRAVTKGAKDEIDVDEGNEKSSINSEFAIEEEGRESILDQPAFVIPSNSLSNSARPTVERKNEGSPEIQWNVIVTFLTKFIENSRHPSSLLSPFFLSLMHLLHAILEFGLYQIPKNNSLLDLMTPVLWINLEEDVIGSSDVFQQDKSVMMDIKVQVCKIIETYFVDALRTRLSAMANKCQKSDAIQKTITDQIAAERRNMSAGALRNENLEEVLLSLLGHRNARLSGFAMRLLVCSRSRQIAAYEAIAHKMKFIKMDEELAVHDDVVTKCLPEILDACDSLAACDPVRVCDSIRKLVEMCVIKNKKKILPNAPNQTLLACLGVHTAVLKYVRFL
jgi:hypothetical protein